MKRGFLSVSALLMVAMVVTAGAALAQPITGSLSFPSGLVGTADWASGSTLLSWVITPPSATGGLWTYQYTFNANRKDISHFIVELSPGLTTADILNVSVPTWSINTFTSTSQGNSNPGLPRPIYGIKFDSLTGTTATVSFQTLADPVKGDFYAKSGVTSGVNVYAYNAAIAYADETATFGKILRPDTGGGTPAIPEASSLMLGGIGLLPLMAARKRFRR